MKWIMLNQERVRVREISDGIAYVCCDGVEKWLELNRNLKKYPVLLQMVLDHEKLHLVSRRKIDFWVDFKAGFMLNLGLARFIFRYPRCLFAFVPVRKKYGVWGVNRYLLLSYVFWVCLIIFLILLKYKDNIL